VDRATLRQARDLYAGAARLDRLHIGIRMALCPFARLAAFVPTAGLVVDLGCGHGLFACALALESARRCVVGVEPSPAKLAAARMARQRLGRVDFVQGDALANPVCGPCQAILLIDVLYLLAPGQQEAVLRACLNRLAPGGTLLIKTMDDRPRWKAALNELQEWLAVRMLRVTLGTGRAFAFRPLAEWQALCEAIGFAASVVRLDVGYYHPHGAVIGVRP
jgi:SAM-dependent methyltransferase